MQLDFIGPIRFKQRRFFILISIDRYSRWPAVCICDAPIGKTTKPFLEQLILLNSIPQTIRLDKGMASTGNEFRSVCKKLNIKLIYGTAYIHTATGLVERGIKTLKDLMRTNLEDKCTVSEALSRSLTSHAHDGPLKHKRNAVRKTLRKKAKIGNNKLFKLTNGYK